MLQGEAKALCDSNAGYWCLWYHLSMNYATRHVGDLFHVSGETVRNWANEFVMYLSVVGNPPKGKQRRFTDEDLSVFSLVAEMKQRGATFDEIHMALAAGQRGAPLQFVQDERSVARSEEEPSIALQVQYLQQTLARMEQQRDEALAQVQPFKDEIIRIQAQLDTSRGMYESRIQELNEQLKEAQRRAEELIREAAKAYYQGLREAQPDNNHSSSQN